MENTVLLSKLYSLKKEIKEDCDLKIIDNLIDKYNNIPFSIDFEYTEREFSGSKNVFINILKSIYKEPECFTMNEEQTKVISVDEVLYDKLILFDDKCDKLIFKYSILRIKNNKQKNSLSRQNSILIQNLFIEEINELITKIF
jgi:hypothetical protein